MVFKICEGISCSPFSVKELDVIVHENYFLKYPYSSVDHFVPHITSEPDGRGEN